MSGSQQLRFDLQDIEAPIQLFVEGRDFCFCLIRLLRVTSDPCLDRLQIRDYAPIGLEKSIRQLAMQRGFTEQVEGIGVIRDAEDSADAAARHTATCFDNADLPIPSEAGTPIGSVPRTGFLIVPPGQEKGCLENVLLEAYAGPYQNCARQFLECVNDPSRNENWRRKVEAHALLAASPKPEATLSLGFETGVWDAAGRSLAPVLAFIRELAGPAKT